MSEYQYFEFLALDQPLTESEMKELRSISSRAEITTNSFVNVYNYGDLSADPMSLLLDYFDVFVYVSNFGWQRVAFRFPVGSVDRENLEYEGLSDVVELHERGEYEAVEFNYSSEPSGWKEGVGWMSRLTPVRDALLRGNRIPAYLGWLSAADRSLVADDAVEPPVPNGLNEPEYWVRALAEFLHVDDYLLDVASEQSYRDRNVERAVMTAIESLEGDEKDVLLAEVYRGNEAAAVAKLSQAIERVKCELDDRAARYRRCALELRDRADELHRESLFEGGQAK